MKFKTIYFWFGLPILIIVMWLLAFYMPVSAYLDKQRKGLNETQRSRATLEASIKDILEIRKRDAHARSSLNSISGTLPLYHQFPGVIRAVAEAGRREGIAFETMNSMMLPSTSEQMASLVKPVIDTSLKGRFLDIGKFLERVENQKGYKRIASGRLSYSEKDYPVLTGRFLIEFRAWKGDRTQ